MRKLGRLREEAGVAMSLLPLLRHRTWGLAGLVALGVLTSLAEGFRVSLFIPFLQGMNAGEGRAATKNRLADAFGVMPVARHSVGGVSPLYAGMVMVKLLCCGYNTGSAIASVDFGEA